ncbi:MAG: Do family serine endopeptidase [Desulfobacterales bacterium]|nr:Do family serine endopeptidase [Desulfobacterales bacterium]MCP4158724.1 Do family serine endopeptidase [Deltaproteobacteria bacterium]
MNKIINRHKLLILTAVFLFSVTSVSSAATKIPANFSELAKNVKTSVVNIRTEKTVKGSNRVYKHFFGDPNDRNNPFREFFGPNPRKGYKQRSLGSGFIIDKKGYIVTNNHVVENADVISVKLFNGKTAKAKIIGRDPKTDLALIKIPESSDLTPIKFGDSEKIEVGEWVIAIGSPFGFEQTVTAGIISGKGRVIGQGPYDNFLQTDASINPGNSGGPLINLKGKVIGINTAIIKSGYGIGFAIPVNMAKGIISQLKNSGEVNRGWLGVGIQDLTPDLAKYYKVKNKKGVLVVDVYKGHPASKAGIRINDIIISVNGKKVTTGKELSLYIASIKAGEKVKLKVLRSGRTKTIYASLGKRSKLEKKARKNLARGFDEIGISVNDVTPEMRRRYGLDKGIIITAVEQNSIGSKAGFRRGDMILEVNRISVKTKKKYMSILDNTRKGEQIDFLIKRANSIIIPITITK